MSFKVEPDRRQGFAKELFVIEQSAGMAVAHTAHTKPQVSGGALMLRMMDGLNDVEGAVRGVFTHLERILGESVDELRDTARDYRLTDLDAAAAADAERGRL